MEASPAADHEISLSPERVAEMMEEGEVEVVDVREAKEWDAGHVPGARHIEIDQIPARADSIDRKLPVVFQCRSGSRSEMIADAFRQSGWDAYNMDGGLAEWTERGLPLEPEGGRIVER